MEMRREEGCATDSMTLKRTRERIAGMRQANSPMDDRSDVAVQDGLILTIWGNGRDNERGLQATFTGGE